MNLGNGWAQLGNKSLNGTAYFNTNQINSVRILHDRKSILTNRIGKEEKGDEMAYAIEIDQPSSVSTVVYIDKAEMLDEFNSLLKQLVGNSEAKFDGTMSQVY